MREAFEKGATPRSGYTLQESIRKTARETTVCGGCGQVLYAGEKCRSCVRAAKAVGARVPLAGGTGAKRLLKPDEDEAIRILRARAYRAKYGIGRAAERLLYYEARHLEKMKDSPAVVAEIRRLSRPRSA